MGLGWLRPGDAPEPVPSDALKGIGPAPGYRVQVIDDPVQRDQFLRQNGVAANDSFNGHRIVAGVVPALKLVVLPPDASGDLTDHENLHSYNAQHFPGGSGWELAGEPPSGIDPKVQAALLALPRAPATTQPMAFDWGKAFGPQPPTNALLASASTEPPSPGGNALTGPAPGQ